MRQELANILCDLTQHKGTEIVELFRLMEGTTLEGFMPNVEKAIDFEAKSGKWPAFDLICAGLEEFAPDPGKGTSDFLIQLKFDLQEEYFKSEAQAAVNSGDWDLLEQLVLKRSQITHRKFVPYTPSHAYEEYEKMEKSASGIFMGVSQLDEVLRGISFKSTSVWAAPPSMFKTSAAISASFHNAYHEGFNVLYVTMEVPKRNIWFQILSRFSPESGNKERLVAEDIKKVLLTEGGKKRFSDLRHEWDKTAKGSLHIADQDDLGDGTYKSLLSMLDSVSEQLPEGEEIDIVIWDYIQLFKFFRPKHLLEAEYLNGLVRYTDSLCKSYRERGFVNIILSQVNRQGQLKIASKNRADLTLLAEVNELERSGNSVVVFYSDEGMRLDNQLNAQVVKHRDGKVMEEMETIYVDPEISQVGTGSEKFTVGLDDLDLLGTDWDGDATIASEGSDDIFM